MSEFDTQSFNQFVLDGNVYGFFEEPVTLKSGRQSYFYANWRDVVKDAWLTRELVDYVLSFVADHNIPVDTFYGVPEGATKLGVLAQYTWAQRQPGFGPGSHVLAMGRARPKDHGPAKDRFFVGAPEGKVVLIEDATTTGGSLFATLDRLQDGGLEVSALLSLTNRMEKRDDGLSVEQFAATKGVAFYSLSSALEILPQAYAKLQPGEEVGKAIEREYAEYGVGPVKLV